MYLGHQGHWLIGFGVCLILAGIFAITVGISLVRS